MYKNTASRSIFNQLFSNFFFPGCGWWFGSSGQGRKSCFHRRAAHGAMLSMRHILVLMRHVLLPLGRQSDLEY
jgi:hypothetical protein